MSDQLYDEYGDPVDVEYVDENGFTTEERLARIEAAITAVQSGQYDGEDEYYDEAEEEEAWLDAVAADAAALETRIGRELTQGELNTLAAFAEATGQMPTEAYGAAVPERNLSNEDDRIALAAEIIEQTRSACSARTSRRPRG
jgi:hypothetical protein